MALAEELHESCSASVLDGADIVYIARAQTNRIMTISLTVGTRSSVPPRWAASCWPRYRTTGSASSSPAPASSR